MQGKRRTLDDDAAEPREAPASTTLEQQLERYQQHWSAVDFDRDDPAQLLVRYGRRGPRAWWPLVPGFGCIGAAVLLPFFSPLAAGVNGALAAALGVAALALLLAWRSCVNLRLGAAGLAAAPFPPLTGPTTRVNLKQIRRFRVEKSGGKGKRRYAVHCLTRDDRELPLIRKIRIKDDAYLVSMLLIDRVKSLR